MSDASPASDRPTGPADDTANEPGRDDADRRVDVIVLGMGPGGEVVANRLASAGRSVVGIEDRLVGGECAYWACVPSKAMLHAAHLLADARRAGGGAVGWAGTTLVDADWGPVADRVRDVTSGWDDSEAVQAFLDRGGRFVRGRGRITGPATVEVDGETWTAAEALVVATGTAPLIPPIDGLDGTPYWTNREAVEATGVPTSLVVLGAGPVGCELAQTFARFGSEVTLVEAADRVHGGDEPEATGILAAALERDGIDLHLGREATGVDHDGTRFTIRLDDDTALTADQLLVVAGRDPRLHQLGAGNLGVDADAAGLTVDADLRVADGVWAVGDVTGGPQFTHAARDQARHIVDQILGRPLRRPPDHAIPHVTFTDPELAAVGHTEEAARAEGIDVATGVVRGGARAWLAGREDDCLIKVVADRDRDVLVGATVIGPRAGEVLGLLTLAVHAELPVDQLRTMVHPYPTYHRAVADAVDALDR